MSFIITRDDHASVNLVAGPVNDLAEVRKMLRSLNERDGLSQYAARNADFTLLDPTLLEEPVVVEDEPVITMGGDTALDVHVSRVEDGVETTAGVLSAPSASVPVDPPEAILSEEAGPIPSTKG